MKNLIYLVGIIFLYCCNDNSLIIVNELEEGRFHKQLQGNCKACFSKGDTIFLDKPQSFVLISFSEDENLSMISQGDTLLYDDIIHALNLNENKFMQNYLSSMVKSKELATEHRPVIGAVSRQRQLIEWPRDRQCLCGKSFAVKLRSEIKEAELFVYQESVLLHNQSYNVDNYLVNLDTMPISDNSYKLVARTKDVGSHEIHLSQVSDEICALARQNIVEISSSYLSLQNKKLLTDNIKSHFGMIDIEIY